MHAAAIVPERHIIVRPAEANLEFNLFAMIAQHLEEHAALFSRQLIDPGSKGPVYIQCFSFCVGVRAHDRVHGGRA